jgi:hypothetical protein
MRQGVKMSWSDRFRDYYASKRRTFAWIYVAVSAVIVLCTVIHVLPFTYASMATKGIVTTRDCWGKGISYTFRYDVEGQAYTGKTDLGMWDGTGPCEKLAPGVEVPMTYRMDDPSRSMSGTLGSWSKATGLVLLRLAVFCFVILPVAFYVRDSR